MFFAVSGALLRIPWIKALPILAAFALLSPQLGLSQVPAPVVAPTVPDLAGQDRDPLGREAAAVTILLFVRIDCPISNRYVPEIIRLQKKFSAQDVRFWLVYPEEDATAATIAQHQKDFQISLPALRDPKHRLVEFAHTSVTPEASVFVKGREVYQGRIDDREVEIGQSRVEPTTRDLEDAIRDALAGKPVAAPVTRAIGCFIESAE